METKVGSPPMVRRTSPALQDGIDLLPSASSASRFVRKRLGDARMLGDARHRIIETEFHIGKAAMPEIGAALR
jgi:hypothetical protein